MLERFDPTEYKKLLRRFHNATKRSEEKQKKLQIALNEREYELLCYAIDIGMPKQPKNPKNTNE